MHNVAAHFRILQLIINRDANMEHCKEDEEKFCFSIKQRVRRHLSVIELAETFNGVYQNILFMKFTISCIQIAILTYQLAKGHELSAQLFHLLFIISVSLQLILYCYGGQRIKDEVNIFDLFLEFFVAIAFLIISEYCCSWCHLFEFQVARFECKIAKTFIFNHLEVPEAMFSDWCILCCRFETVLMGKKKNIKISYGDKKN